jgi:hypothetical protein
MADEALLRKLGAKQGQRVCVLGAPEGYVARLGQPGEVALASGAGGAFDLVHLFVRDRSALRSAAASAVAAVRPGGRLWVSYPKRSSKVPTDLTRDVGWEPLVDAGWVAVTQISVDEVWSALRFRPAAEVGT